MLILLSYELHFLQVGRAGKLDKLLRLVIILNGFAVPQPEVRDVVGN